MPTRTSTANRGSELGSHPELIYPTSTSEMEAMVKALNHHHNALYADLSNISGWLRVNLPKAIEEWGGSRGWTLGLDAKMAARRIAKPIDDAAKLNREVARLWVVAGGSWHEHAVNVSAKKAKPTKINLGA